MAVLRRDEGLCRDCLGRGVVKAADEVHHVKPIRSGGDPWDVSNLRSLCRNCHQNHHETDPLAAERRRWRVFATELALEESDNVTV